MKIHELLEKSIGIEIPGERINRFLEENNIGYHEYLNSYEIYSENKMIIVNFEKVETGHFGKSIIVKNYEEKDYPQALPLADINNRY